MLGETLHSLEAHTCWFSDSLKIKLNRCLSNKPREAVIYSDFTTQSGVLKPSLRLRLNSHFTSLFRLNRLPLQPFSPMSIAL